MEKIRGVLDIFYVKYFFYNLTELENFNGQDSNIWFSNLPGVYEHIVFLHKFRLLMYKK